LSFHGCGLNFITAFIPILQNEDKKNIFLREKMKTYIKKACDAMNLKGKMQAFETEIAIQK